MSTPIDPIEIMINAFSISECGPNSPPLSEFGEDTRESVKTAMRAAVLALADWIDTYDGLVSFGVKTGEINEITGEPMSDIKMSEVRIVREWLRKIAEGR